MQRLLASFPDVHNLLHHTRPAVEPLATALSWRVLCNMGTEHEQSGREGGPRNILGGRLFLSEFFSDLQGGFGEFGALFGHQYGVGEGGCREA